ncbi:ABC transporter substrate-binding protein [Phyllobacterium sp. YR531]|uniref:ABC transporter substrate-binding protein n=1 Tax=Phyllobacterium sp. YR531 TaxID=1144343 RepID=UPI0003126AEC|nr:ABC transporter substrate-binding protein [Phyllobacterium sp. YR531]
MMISAGSSAYAQDTSPDQRAIVHQLGSTTITGNPKNIIALEYSFVEALDALGVVPAGIADDNQPKRINQLLGKKIEYKSVGTRLEPNLELVSSIAPDLIVADELRHSNIYDQLGSIAPTVVLNSWEGGYSDIKNSLITIADALGIKATGEKVIKDHEAAIAELAKKVPVDEKRSFLLAVVTPDVLTLHTSSSFSGSVFTAMGLKPALISSKPLEGGVGLERLASINPDVLFIATDAEGTLLDQWRTNPVWLNISAVRNGKVFEVDRNQYTRFRGLRTAMIIARDVVDNLYAK